MIFNDVLASESTVKTLAGRDIEGYLNGFIDLVCESEGRYYVVDYKTNNLGPEDAYHHEGLVQ
ncbi:MAG: PD-(D/E)XK nuclease family protein, partial [Desulfofustis sp.]